jgi:Cft2 family RNA processing exonuclease
LIRLGVVSEVPIYIGGLSTKLTEIYDRPAKRGSVAGAGGLKGARNIFTMSGPEAFSTRIKPGRIYALSSGMMTEQTLSHQLAPQFLSDPKHSIYFVGYADPDSPAGLLRQTKREEFLHLRADADPLPVRCEVEQFSFSGHATRESIRAWINLVRPKNVFLVHGDLPALAWFREALARDLPESRIIIPEPGVPVEIA